MIRILLILVVLSCQLHFAYAQKKELTPQNKQLINNLIASGRFVKFNPNPLNWHRSESLQLFGPVNKGFSYFDFSGESDQHAQGIYGSVNISFVEHPAVNNFQGFTLNSDNYYLTLSEKLPLLNKDVCLERATALYEQVWPNFKKGAFTEPKPTIVDEELDYKFEWSAFDAAGTFLRFVRVTIRKIDGKCIHLSTTESDLNTKIKAPTALEMARSTVKADTRLSNIKLRKWSLDARSERSEYVVEFDVTLDKKSTGLEVIIDASNGILFELFDDELKRLNLGPPTESGNGQGNDYARWTRQGLVFISDQFHQSFEKKRRKKLMLRDSNGKIGVVYNVLDSDISIAFSNSSSDWIVLKNRQKTYAINLANGNTETQPFSQKLLQPLAWPLHVKPVLGNNGKYVYFAISSKDKKSGRSGMSIRRIAYEKLGSNTSNSLKKSLKQSVELHFTTQSIVSLQVYPQEDQILLSNNVGARWLLDLKAHRETLLTFKSILQKNTPRLSTIYDLRVGRKSNEVTVRAKTNKNPIQIYLCKTDGSGLIQITLVSPQIARRFKD